jgi:hypothetical protein
LGGLLPLLRRRERGVWKSFGFLEPSDELVCFVACEPASGLTLVEPHRAAGVLEVTMSCRLDERKQVLQLPR